MYLIMYMHISTNVLPLFSLTKFSLRGISETALKYALLQKNLDLNLHF